MHMKNASSQNGDSPRDVKRVKLELELRKMWRLINRSMHILSWCLCDIFACFRACECWHGDYFVYILDVSYCILFLVIIFLYIFAHVCIYLFHMTICHMTTLLLHGVWFVCLCGTHMHLFTLIHMTQLTHSLYSFFFLCIRDISQYSFSSIVFSLFN